MFATIIIMGRHIFQDRTTADGTRQHCAVSLNDDGCLVVTTHDIGPTVEKFFGTGVTEYEAFETFNPAQTQQIRDALGVADSDDSALLRAIGRQFGDNAAHFGSFAGDLCGRGRVWNRVGD